MLNPDAQAIAIGGTISEDSNAGGALAFVYTFFDTYYQPVGSHWGVQAILILFEELPGGET